MYECLKYTHKNVMNPFSAELKLWYQSWMWMNMLQNGTNPHIQWRLRRGRCTQSFYVWKHLTGTVLPSLETSANMRSSPSPALSSSLLMVCLVHFHLLCLLFSLEWWSRLLLYVVVKKCNITGLCIFLLEIYSLPSCVYLKALWFIACSKVVSIFSCNVFVCIVSKIHHISLDYGTWNSFLYWEGRLMWADLWILIFILIFVLPICRSISIS